MKSKFIAFLVSVVLIVGLPMSAWCKAPSMAEILPADSLGYAELSDMEVIYYVVSEIGEAAIRSVEEEPAAPQDIKAKARAILEAFNEIKPLLPKSGSLGVVSIDPRGGKPSLVFVSEISDWMAPLAMAAGKLLAAVPEVKVVRTDYGTEVVIPHGDTPPIGYAVKDNVLYLTMGEGLLDRVLSERPAETLASTAHFKDVQAVTGKNAFLSAYANLDAIRDKFLPMLPPQGREFAELFGLKDIHAAGVSLSADEERVGFNLALQYTADAPGIASLLSVPNTSPKGIAYVPDDFSYVTRFSIGPPAEFMKKIRAIASRAGKEEGIDQAFGEIQGKAGIDVNKVLASLGGEITVGVKVPETLRVPDVVACVEAKDPEYLTGLLKELLTKMGVEPSEAEVDGRKVMTIALPGSPVSPAIASDGEAIVISLSSAVLQKAFAAKASGQNIASKPSFNAAMEGLPAKSNIGLEYLELNDLGKLAVVGLGMAAAHAPQEAGPVVARGMEYLNEAIEGLEPGAEVIYRTPSGLAIQSRMGTRSLMQLLRNGAAFGAKALLLLHPPVAGPVPPMEEAVEEAAEIEEVSEEGKVFINLDPHVTLSLRNLHNTEGNDLTVRRGTQQMGDSAYRIGQGIVQLAGQNFQEVPREVKGVKAGLKFKKLHILHATGWGSGVAAGTQIGSYVIHYEDGSTVEIPIKYGVHVRDWWVQSDDGDVSEAKVAWTGRNNQSDIRLYSMMWENPNPDDLVTAIDFSSAGTACAPFLVAMTAETE